MITAGYDIGTRFVKVCIADEDKIIGYDAREVGKELEKTIEAVLDKSLDAARIRKGKIERTVATGYGAELVKQADYTLAEPPCLARAVFQLDRSVRTVVEVGGLFIHIAEIGESGYMTDSSSNEKCAAGSGKFMEIISEAIEVPFEAISAHASKAKNPYQISSTCAVFAESEIISQINAGADSSDILAGVINSVASKAVTLLEKMSAGKDVALVGGVAKIEAFRSAFEKLSGKNVKKLTIDSQITAAYGAALLAQGKRLRRGK